MKKVKLYTDGACRGNPGRGGYGSILQFVMPDGKIVEKEFSQGFQNTTNNRMELLAVIVGLEALKEACEVEIFSDSKYVCQAFNENWIEGWRQRNYITSRKKTIKNIDLWKRLIALVEANKCSFSWVKGHDGHEFNERCDVLATTAADDNAINVDKGFNEVPEGLFS
ncbi:MAG: ribonuclease HI [Eggerthellaceae bacterium]|nr:ribonuclease HI [Eggerthellaceae bacterium]